MSESRTLLVDALGTSRWTQLAGLAAVACVLVPGALFVWLGPSNTLVEAGVGAVCAALSLVLAIAVPAAVQDRVARKKLAALGHLPGFSIDRYRELLSQPRTAGRLVANARYAAPPSEERRAELAAQLAGWHLEWDGDTLLAETDAIPGELALQSRFKSSGAPASVPTNAAYHARFEQLVAAMGEVTKLTVDIVDA